jgi:hypothetical protein
VRETADLAVAPRQFGEVEVANRVSELGTRFDAGLLEQGVADQVGWPIQGVTETQVDVRFPKIDGQELCMAVGKMNETRLSE